MTKEAITPISSTGKRDPAEIARRYSEQLAAAAEESSYREVPANLRHLSPSSDSSGRPGVAIHGVPVGFPAANPMGSHLGLIAAAQPTKPGLVFDSQALGFRVSEASHDLERIRPTASGSPLAVDFAGSPVGNMINNFLSVKPAITRADLRQPRMASLGIDEMAEVAQAALNYDLMALVLQSAIAQSAQILRSEYAADDAGYNAAMLGYFMGIRQRFAEVRAGGDKPARSQARHLERACTRAFNRPEAEPFRIYSQHAEKLAKAGISAKDTTAIAAAIPALPPKVLAALAKAGNQLADPALQLALAAAIISIATQKTMALERPLTIGAAGSSKKVASTQSQKHDNEMELRAIMAYLEAAKDVLEAQEANKEEQAREYARRKDDEHRQDDEKMREKTRVVRELSVAIHRVSMFKGKAALSPAFSVMLDKELAALSQAAAALTATATTTIPPAI